MFVFCFYMSRKEKNSNIFRFEQEMNETNLDIYPAAPLGSVLVFITMYTTHQNTVLSNNRMFLNTSPHRSPPLGSGVCVSNSFPNFS